MKDLGVDAYRFSISWSRILPDGKISGGVNQEGIQYYNNVINELMSKGIEPYVTIFHWDFPQSLEDQYGGFLSPLVVEDFREYADICFKSFGDRVKNWITFNEPWTYCHRGYAAGIFAPGRCSPWEAGNCSAGDSGREPYIVAHHLILAHASAVKLYRDKYLETQKGKVGITLNTNWFLPYSNAKSNRDAVDRALDFMFGWFMDPLTQGDYPFNMRALVGDRLPKFTQEQSEMIRGSFDFLGLNYYTTNYANSISLLANVNVSYDGDRHAFQTGEHQGILVGPKAASDWLFIYPPGIRRLLLYIKNKYNNPNIYITENGVDEANNAMSPLEQNLKDDMRVDYYRQHLSFVRRAIREGVNVKGYFAWSMFDNFEWIDGYTVRFGLYYVDYKTMTRYPKSSALWLHEFLKK
ncbi:beta-glucosidase 12-like [Asparagus officinalis]|uniref:beta-glucosidase 12-like n=1 Tax=Asparagus officinalis TaxID=4686 RepID=UPI00098E5AC9|nr:beta-glucosidase 12-like [Asparagus officinalis]